MTGLVGRCLLTGAYICAALATAATMATVLVKWIENLNCLPPVTDNFGDPVSVESALGRVCDVITYGSFVVVVLCLMIAISVNCCWGDWGWAVWNQTLTVLMCMLSVACGTALTVDFILWCHTLKNAVSEYDGCANAAEVYDAKHKTSNMTAYFRRMEAQQVCQWAVVPFLLFAIALHSFVMKAHATARPSQTPQSPTRRYYLLREEETVPLTGPETAPVRSGTEGSGEGEQTQT